jgi:hypothetical protein
LKLMFGFEANPYRRQGSPTYKAMGGRSATRSQRQYGVGMTAKDVAKELEDKYAIVETFYNMEEDHIVDLIEDAFLEDLEEVMQADKVSRKGISDEATNQIQERFKQNLLLKKYDGVLGGVPTLAAQRGVSHLQAHPFTRRAPRPSFVDTGNYMNSFRVWVEDLEED